MEKINEKVYKVLNCYVGKDCIQTRIPYKKNMAIFSKDGLIYSHKVGDKDCINKYLEDVRREQFPYSNISIYCKKEGFTTFNYVNQLFDFEQPYFIIADGEIMESFVVRDKKEALLVNKVVPAYEGTVYKTRDELEEMFKQPKHEDKNLYILDKKGQFYNFDEVLITEEQIVEWAKKRLSYQFESYKKGTNYKLSYFDEYGMRNLQKCIDNMTIEDVPKVILPNDKMVIKTDGENIFVQSFSIEFIKHDFYRVDVSCYLMAKYTFERVKSLNLNVVEPKERRIPLKLNPEIKKEEVKTAKRLKKILNK